MKNVNRVISQLSHTSMWSRKKRHASNGSFKRAVTDTIIGHSIGKKGAASPVDATNTGAMSTVSSMAWQAYQLYSQGAYGRNASLQRANMQRAYMQGVYAQRNAESNVQEGTKATKQDTKPESGSRYIPSTHEPVLTYSRGSMTRKQFEQVVQDNSPHDGQLLMLRAMITAANADGHIDLQEQQQINQQVEKFDLINDDKAILFDELRSPLSLAQLVAKIPNSQSAVEVYAASLLAIDESQPAAKHYLNQLASAMSLPQTLVDAMHQQVAIS